MSCRKFLITFPSLQGAGSKLSDGIKCAITSAGTAVHGAIMSAARPEPENIVVVRCETSHALSPADSGSGVSADRAGADVPVLQLPDPCLSRSNSAAARIHLRAAHHAGIRVDGEHGSTHRGGEFVDPAY